MKSYQRIGFLLCINALLTLASSLVFAYSADERARSTLAGLKGVHVAVENLGPDIEKEGLTQTQIQTDVELKLGLAGITVLSKEELLMEKGRPKLHVAAHIGKTNVGYVYVCTIKLYQDVSLLRSPGVHSSAPTWSVGHLGITRSLQEIRDRAKYLVDKFINAYLSANPKQEQTKPLTKDRTFNSG